MHIRKESQSKSLPLIDSSQSLRSIQSASSRRFLLYIYSRFRISERNTSPICNTKMSEKPVPAKLVAVESFEGLKDTACKSREYSMKKKKEQPPSGEKLVEKIRKPVEKVTKVHETQKMTSPKDVKDVNFEIFINAPEVAKVHEIQKTESAKIIKDNKSNISTTDSEKSLIKDTKLTENTNKTKKIPVLEKVALRKSWNAAVPRTWAPMSTPNLKERPLVLATHLVPSLPIGLFEVFAEILEVITKKPVVLLHETRIGRPVAKDISDIAILPAAEDWEDGVLLPASFVFEHHLNKSNSPCVYADIIVAADRALHVEDVMDLRGHRCAIPDRRNQISAAGLLFNHLHMKGESPAFFGNTLDASSQLAVLQMIAGKQAEVGILEAPVIRCHKFAISGAEFLNILASMGPLPPYRIMINKVLVDKLVKELATYLLNINRHEEWLDRLSSFGVIGFAENSTNYYNLDDMKSVVTSVPYY